MWNEAFHECPMHQREQEENERMKVKDANKYCWYSNQQCVCIKTALISELNETGT
jgi:hypothetical protein